MQTDQDPGQEEHKTWHEFANRLLAVGSNLFGSAEISLSEKGASDVKAQALTLLCRTLSHLQLCGRGADDHALLFRELVLRRGATRARRRLRKGDGVA